MSMRLFTKKDFWDELKRYGLSETEYRTDTVSMWRASSGKYIPVPVLPRGQKYPDYMLDTIILMI
jgi:hypothetical protein